ncbi:MAG: response regulator, partial [bacterium]|nr:response regulator [bacterium]
IFEAFIQQPGQETSKYGGSGLGLTITRRLVQLMNGDLDLKSDPGKGSTFTVSLRDVATALSKKTKENVEHSGWQDVRFDEASIVVADDVSYNCELIKGFLEPYDITVLEAVNGKAAVEVTRQYRPALVLMDMKMPVMDGYKAVEILKGDAQLKDIPIIALTASVMKGNETSVLEAGCDGFLGKPIEKRQLIAELMRFLSHYREEEAPKQAEVSPAFSNPEAKSKLPRLLEILESKLMPKWERIHKTFILHEVEDFVDQILELGKEYGVSALGQWGRTLRRELQNFEVNRVEEELKYFPTLLRKLKEL